MKAREPKAKNRMVENALNFKKTTIRKANKYINKIKDRKLIQQLEEEEIKWIQQIHSQKLTYLPKRKLAAIVTLINQIKEKQLEGGYIEAGCALGGSSILIAKCKNQISPFTIYDVFGMIPPPSEEDTEDVHNRYKVIKDGKSTGIGGDEYYGYQDNLYEKVISNLQDFNIDLKKENVNLIKGLVQNTLRVSTPIVFAHVDVDWYDPVKTCLDRIWPNLSIGGTIILDDYYAWGGCKKATNEFLKLHPGEYAKDGQSGALMVTKLAKEVM